MGAFEPKARAWKVGDALRPRSHTPGVENDWTEINQEHWWAAVMLQGRDSRNSIKCWGREPLLTQRLNTVDLLVKRTSFVKNLFSINLQLF